MENSRLPLLLLLLATAVAANFSSIFLFGDSLVDYGNNNANLGTYARANFFPYGKDFPGAGIATGRFTNGFLIPDFITSFLGLPFPQPYFSPAVNVLHGVNFASGGSGLYDTTGDVFRLLPSSSYPRPMPLQVQNFLEVKRRLVSQLGERAATKRLNKALFYMTFGSNDIANNYYLEDSPLQRQFTISEFIDVLMEVYESQLQVLYREGARLFVVVSLFPLGCSPAFLISNRIPQSGRCFEKMNHAAQEFNCNLLHLLSSLAVRLPDGIFLYANSYDVPRDIVNRPGAYGFGVSNVGCCNFIGPGPRDNSVVRVCLPASPTCLSVSEYVYWDQFHPTTSTYKIVASLFWEGSTQDIQPLNVKQLARLV